MEASKAPSVWSMMRAQMREGVVYVVTQDPRYVDLLCSSSESLKRAMPDLPITVFSQFPIENRNFDRVVLVDRSNDGFYDKARFMLESPYERTVFLDADIYVAQPFPELFTLLDRFDCAATHEEYMSTDWFKSYERSDIPPSFPEFNTGVLAYRRSEQVTKTFAEWGRLYERFMQEFPGRAINDQPFFRAAAYCGAARIATLGREYNCKFRGQGYLNGQVKLLHGHVKFKMKPDYMTRVANVINRSNRPRVYIGGKVFEQKISGRLWGRRKARGVGSFPEPISITRLRLQRFKELLQQHSAVTLLEKLVSSGRKAKLTRTNGQAIRRLQNSSIQK